LRRSAVQIDLGHLAAGVALAREALPILIATRSKRNGRRADDVRRRLRRHSTDVLAHALDQDLIKIM
jgi:hypothetical protein